jgi:glycerol kinase
MEQDRGAALNANHRLRWIRADGGITHSRLSMQIIADLLKTEVRIDRRHEASAMGAAMLGFIGKGALSFADVERLIQAAPYDVYRPGQVNKGLEAAYQLWNKRI